MHAITLPTGILAAIVLASSPLAGTWTVDAAGGGDFTDLQVAIDAAAPGDVLLIEPIAGAGSYGEIVLTKALDLIGRPGSTQPPKLDALDVQAAPRVTLFSLDIEKLRLEDVPGPALVDACELGHGSSWPGGPDWPPSGFSRFLVEDCADVRVTRCAVEGSEFNATGRSAMLVRGDSRAQLTSSLVRGQDVFNDATFSGWGGHALEVRDTSAVWVAASHLVGGEGEDYWSQGFLVEKGQGGDAVYLRESASVDVRGNSGHFLIGGLGNGLGTYAPPGSNSEDGLAVQCNGFATVGATLGGVAVQGALGPCASVLGAPRPFLSFATPVSQTFDLGPFELPGAPRTVELYGELGAAAVLVGSFGAANLQHPLVESAHLWVDLGLALQVTPTVLAGADTPISASWTTPLGSAFAGLELHLQLFEVLPTGKFVGSNAGALVLGF